MRKRLKTFLACLIAASIGAWLLPVVVQAGSLWSRTYRCKDSTVTVSQDAEGGYHFTSTGRITVDRLSDGRVIRKNGVQVYKFGDDGKQYWLWDGSMQTPRFGSLEVYENGRLVLQLECAWQP